MKEIHCQECGCRVVERDGDITGNWIQCTECGSADIRDTDGNEYGIWDYVQDCRAAREAQFTGEDA